MSITDTKIKAAIKSVQKEIILNDGSNGRGTGTLLLVIRRLAGGGTSSQWFVQAKKNGKRSKLSIGRYPDLSLAAARQKVAAEIAPELLAGKPLRASAPEPATVGTMFAAYVASMKEAGKVSAAEVERVLLTSKTNAADALGRNRQAADIDARDIADYISTFYRKGHRGAADKARSYISSAYGWAQKNANDYRNPDRRDWGVITNPVANVPRDPDATGTRDRTLTAEEIKELWKAASKYEETAGIIGKTAGFSMETAGIIKMLISCGQRVEETIRIDGTEIDIDNAVWTMPAHKTKMKARVHRVPLPGIVLPVLAELKAVHGDGPLFPARNGSTMERISARSLRLAISRWLSNCGAVQPFQTRDIRRTWKSRTGEIGISREIRDMLQQHSRSDTGSVHYDRADYMPQMRAAMQIWNDWLTQNIEGEKQD